MGEDQEPPRRFVMDTEIQPGDKEPERRFVPDTEEVCPSEASQDTATEEGPLTIDTASKESEELPATCLVIDGKVSFRSLVDLS